ncbi:MAG: hypothetical protein ACRD21_07660 [Vicinamibacteria bacterium]
MDREAEKTAPVPVEVEAAPSEIEEGPPPEAPRAVFGNVFEAAKLIETSEPERLLAHASTSSVVPCYRDKADEIRDMLITNRCLALLFIDASHLAHIEHDYGSSIYHQVRNILTTLMLDMRGV